MSEGRVESKEILVVKREEPKPGEKFNKEGFIIRVVQWLFEKKGKDAKPGDIGSSVSLEKRTLYINRDDGTIRTGKTKGFSLADLAAIQPRWKDIVHAMQNPPSPAWPMESTQYEKKSAAPSDEIEEVPF